MGGEKDRLKYSNDDDDDAFYPLDKQGSRLSDDYSSTNRFAPKSSGGNGKQKSSWDDDDEDGFGYNDKYDNMPSIHIGPEKAARRPGGDRDRDSYGDGDADYVRPKDDMYERYVPAVSLAKPAGGGNRDSNGSYMDRPGDRYGSRDSLGMGGRAPSDVYEDTLLGSQSEFSKRDSRGADYPPHYARAPYPYMPDGPDGPGSPGEYANGGGHYPPDSYDAYGGGRPPESHGFIRPYVGKWSRISRAWVNESLILLVFMAIDYMNLAKIARSSAADASSSADQGCSAIEQAGTAISNAPRTAAISAVNMIQRAAQKVVDTTGKMLTSIIDMLESLIVMILKMYLGTYICFAELIIRAALKAIAAAAEKLTEELNKAINTVVDGLQNTAATIAGGLENAANSIANFFTGKKGQTVDFHIDDIRKELNVTIPTDWINSISSLSDKIPTEDQIFGNITKLLDIPFGFIRDALTGGFDKVNISFASKIDFGEPKSDPICDQDPLGSNLIIALGKAAGAIMTTAGIAILAFAGFLLVSHILLIMRSDSTFQKRLAEFRQELTLYNPLRSKQEVMETPVSRKELDFFVLPGRPWLQRLTKFINSKFNNQEKAAAWRWYTDYVLFAPALGCLMAGVIGIISIIVQINLINGLREEYTPKVAYKFNDFQYRIINEEMLGGVRNDSIRMANSINRSINSTEDTLNDALFGPVEKGTKSLNNTLNDFIDTYIGGVRKVFGDNFLEEIIEGILNCTLTKNIQSLQKLLTWFNELASGVEFAQVDNDVLLSPVEALVKPLNVTIEKVRELVVGEYVANATGLDPSKFPTEKQLKSMTSESSEYDSDDYDSDSESSEISGSHGVMDEQQLASIGSDSSVDSLLALGLDPADLVARSTISAIVDSNASSSDVTPSSDFASPETSATPSSSLTSTTSPSPLLSSSDVVVADGAPVIIAAGNNGINRKKRAEEPESASEATHTTTTSKPPAASSTHNSEHSELGDLETEPESGNESDNDVDIDKQRESYYNSIIAMPTSELTQEDIEEAQKYGGYTGGLVGKLCDTYVSNLKSRIPLMLTLIAAWFTIAIFGLAHVARDYSRISKMNLQ
ncbi:plasma membrane fusion protein prm1 [Coemansia sp. Benny D160-2]|nr:plasma membrane fusion protein prm1 [Coemansia sp. Benny D160-2]